MIGVKCLTDQSLVVVSDAGHKPRLLANTDQSRVVVCDAVGLLQYLRRHKPRLLANTDQSLELFVMQVRCCSTSVVTSPASWLTLMC